MLPAPTAAAREWEGDRGQRESADFQPGTGVQREHSEMGKTEDSATEQQL